MPNQEKVEIVGSLKELLADATTVILADHSGLSVKQFSNLRSRLRESDSQFRVVKNTLLKLAAADTPVKELVENLEGPTSVAVTREDPVATAKALADFTKEFKLLSIKSGLVEGRIVSAEQVHALAKIPPKPILLAQVVGGLQAPIAGLVGTLQSTLASLVMTLQAVADKQAA
ncbi:MAG: 50S ribosomal protein L10 [Armatimonadota bacterium]|nr:50S ribosomal protein L10 [Armatimonadota bacterium]